MGVKITENRKSVVDEAIQIAHKAHHTKRPAVFSPPVATFKTHRARQADLVDILVSWSRLIKTPKQPLLP
jgi:hypothetical protein